MRSEVAKTGSAITKKTSALKGFQEGVEKAATATTGMTSALGGMGGKAGAAYGAISNLASAFLAGGPLVVGLAATSWIAGHVADKFLKAKEASETLGHSIDDAILSRQQSVNSTLEGWQQRLDDFGKSATKAARDQAAAQLAIAEASESQGRGHLGQLRVQESKIADREVSRWDVEAKIKKQQDLALVRDRIATQEMLNKSDRESIDGLRQTIKTIDALIKKEEEAEAKRKARIAREAREKARASAGLGYDHGGNIGAALRAQREAEGKTEVTAAEFDAILEAQSRVDAGYEHSAGVAAELALKRELEGKKQLASAQEYEAALTEMSDERRHVEEQRTLAHVNLMKGAWADYYQFIQSGAMSAFSMYLDIVEQSAAGQKIQFESLAASFIKSLGVQLFGIGLGQTFEGAGAILEGIIKNDPKAIGAGGALVSLGTQAMAVGGAMATTGAVMSGRIAAAGGGGGSSSGGRLESRDRERRARGGGGDGDGQSVTIVYNGGTHLGDPTERAVTMARDARRVTREVIMPGGR